MEIFQSAPLAGALFINFMCFSVGAMAGVCFNTSEEVSADQALIPGFFKSCRGVKWTASAEYF